METLTELLAHGTDVTTVVDETETVQSVGGAVERVLGHDPERLVGASVFEYVHPDDRSRGRAAFGRLLDGEASVEEVELRLEHADGSWVWTETRATSRFVAAVGGYVLGSRDVTDRKTGERRHREVLDQMTEGFFAVDTGWRVTHANERGRDLLERATDRDPETAAFEGLDRSTETLDAVGESFYEHCHEAMETREPAEFEEYSPPLEAWLEFRLFPSELGLSVYFRDITDRRRRRAALERRETTLREVYEIISDRDATFTEQVEALLAVCREELGVAFGTLSRIDGEEYVVEVIDAATDTVRAGDVVPLEATNCEMAARDRQTIVLGDIDRDAPAETDRAGYTEWGVRCYIGTPVFVDGEVYGTFCFYGTEPRDGQFTDWEVTLVDLLGQWAGYELQRQATTDRLAEKNENIERLASALSHDLRNPLSVLDGSLALARETGDREHFERCERAVDRIERLADDLLTLMRAGDDVVERETVTLESLVRGCWETVATAEASLVVESDRELAADRSRAEQLFENLFRNAVEHGGDGVTVRVGTLPDDDGFYVEDDGPGIPSDERDEVLEWGYSTQTTGTGFGLGIVTTVADAHGWSLTVTEGDTGGARFEVRGVAGGPVSHGQ